MQKKTTQLGGLFPFSIVHSAKYEIIKKKKFSDLLSTPGTRSQRWYPWAHGVDLLIAQPRKYILPQTVGLVKNKSSVVIKSMFAYFRAAPYPLSAKKKTKDYGKADREKQPPQCNSLALPCHEWRGREEWLTKTNANTNHALGVSLKSVGGRRHNNKPTNHQSGFGRSSPPTLEHRGIACGGSRGVEQQHTARVKVELCNKLP
jgi:hypothetical protein